MWIRMLISLSWLVPCLATGQMAHYKGYSADFNFTVRLIPSERELENPMPHQVTVVISTAEEGKFVQQLDYEAGYLPENAFSDSGKARSYSTGKNQSEEIADGIYGDLVIADFNFDDREDLAVFFDMGGNGGRLYHFFAQTHPGVFAPYPFLEGTVGLFPNALDRETQTATTASQAGACNVATASYRFDGTQWHLLERQVENICDDRK